MLKTLKLLAISGAVFSFTFFASAQEANRVTPTITPVKPAALKERIEAKRYELKERLITIKDERKRQVVEKIDKALDALNERMMDHFDNVLDRLDKILIKIRERADRAEESGYDVSTVGSAIETARQAIADARAAIEVQVGKTHTIPVTAEESLRTNVGKARQALHEELSLVFKKIKLAKEAVHDVAKALADLRGNNGEPIVCTQEAKICPDGSSVSRTGPNCKFAACPKEATPTPN